MPATSRVEVRGTRIDSHSNFVATLRIHLASLAFWRQRCPFARTQLDTHTHTMIQQPCMSVCVCAELVLIYLYVNI